MELLKIFSPWKSDLPDVQPAIIAGTTEYAPCEDPFGNGSTWPIDGDSASPQSSGRAPNRRAETGDFRIIEYPANAVDRAGTDSPAVATPVQPGEQEQVAAQALAFLDIKIADIGTTAE